MATVIISGFLLVSLTFSAVDSASIARVSERDLLELLNRVARTESFSFYKEVGNTTVGGYYNKENNTAGFNATHKFHIGNFTADFHWGDDHWWGSKFDENFNFDDNDDEEAGKDEGEKGGFHGEYSWNNGEGNFSFHHKW